MNASLQELRMNRMGGGIFVAVGLLAGGVLGASAGEGSAGILVGLVLGLAVALAFTLWDERRRRR